MKKTNFKFNAMYDLHHRTDIVYKWLMIVLSSMMIITCIIMLYNGLIIKNHAFTRKYEPISDFIICTWFGYMVIHCIFYMIIEKLFNNAR